MSGFKQWSRSMQTTSSSSLKTKPRPTPAVEAAALECVLHVRRLVLLAALPAVVSGRLPAARRIHLSRIFSSCGIAFFFAARWAATRHRVEQKRARCE
ncbi:hypothetical protein AB0A77_02185 [Streptomyces varsoviensis]|uniref:hypothetical protein n=1 Tax=Streptomyces varsoviensis TaxID=67373 RepID=UPI0034112EE5